MLPWEITTEVIRDWIVFLSENELAVSTIRVRITGVSKFYEYCIEQGSGNQRLEVQEPGDRGIADRNAEEQGRTGAGERGYRGTAIRNPTMGLKTLARDFPIDTQYLDEEEVEALLGAIDIDRSPLGKRDYAILQTVLGTGQHMNPVRTLKWGQLEIKKDLTQVQWKRGLKQRVEVYPLEAWTAVLEYLIASGRIENIDKGCYVFAAAKMPYSPSVKKWDETRALNKNKMLENIRNYASWAGLDPKQIRWQRLRNTAVVRRLQRGMDVEAIHSLLGQSRLRDTRVYIQNLLAEEKVPFWKDKTKPSTEISPIKRYRPGQRVQHGASAKYLLEDIFGVEELKALTQVEYEVARNRIIICRAMELMDETEDYREIIKLVEICGQSAVRIAKNKKLEAKEKEWKMKAKHEEEILKELERIGEEMGITDKD
jgi:site-specific recombinase XerD